MKEFITYRRNLKKFFIKYHLEYLRELPECYRQERVDKEVVKQDVCYAENLQDVYYKLTSMYSKNARVKNLEVLKVV